VQFQLASAILEEVGGLRQEEVVSELLSLGLAAVLDSAARAANQTPGPAPSAPLDLDLDLDLENRRSLTADLGPGTLPIAGSRSIN
jgi:hypothetical protein